MTPPHWTDTRAFDPGRFVTHLNAVPGLRPEEREKLEPVARRFRFQAPAYYLSRISWRNPTDPLRRIVVPDPRELEGDGSLDPSNEKANRVLPGVQHKYRDTVVVLLTDQCAGLCRYCFRKRLFMQEERECLQDLGTAVRYVAEHPEIRDVLLTGGDPLVLPTARLREAVLAFAAVPHVATIRIGSKTPAYNPLRILKDPGLFALVREVRTRGKALAVMTHFDHPAELGPEARRCVERFLEAGAQVFNQCPLVRGLNDDPEVLAELYQELVGLGATPYYLFQMRPAVGNRAFAVPIVEGWQILHRARRRLSGLARRVRYAMSHASGKIEIVGVDEGAVYARYHRARNPADEDRVLVLPRNDRALWLEDFFADAEEDRDALAS
ncbi:KamA family radical SAM protein [Deferrisoma sp.]